MVSPFSSLNGGFLILASLPQVLNTVSLSLAMGQVLDLAGNLPRLENSLHFRVVSHCTAVKFVIVFFIQFHRAPCGERDRYIRAFAALCYDQNLLEFSMWLERKTFHAIISKILRMEALNQFFQICQH